MSRKKLEIIKSFIKDNFIMTLATSKDNKPYVCSVFYIVKEPFTLYFTSVKNSLHCKHIKENPNVACNIYKHNTLDGYEDEKIGVQILGKCAIVKSLPEAVAALTIYGKKFLSAKTWYKDARGFIKDGELYKIKIDRVKMMDSSNNIKPEEYLDFLN